MGEVLKELGWTYVAIIHSDNSYGREAKDALLQNSKKLDLCVAFTAEINSALSVDEVKEKLKPMVTLTIKAAVFIGCYSSRVLFQALETLPGAGNLQWLVSECVGTDADMLNNKKSTPGVISLAPASRTITEFENYWMNIDFSKSDPLNPRRTEWYMRKHNCKFSGVTEEPYVGYPDCVPKSETERRAEYVQRPDLESAITSVYAYAKALKNAHASLCKGVPGLCKELLDLDASDFYDYYLKNVIKIYIYNVNNKNGRLFAIRHHLFFTDSQTLIQLPDVQVTH